MATLTVQSIDKDGAAITLSSAAGGGDVFANDADERTYLVVHNDGGGSVTVTITAQTTSVTVPHYGTLAQADVTLAVASGAVAHFGPFETKLFNNSSNQVEVGYSGVTSVTVAAVKLGTP